MSPWGWRSRWREEDLPQLNDTGDGYHHEQDHDDDGGARSHGWAIVSVHGGNPQSESFGAKPNEAPTGVGASTT